MKTWTVLACSVLMTWMLHADTATRANGTADTQGGKKDAVIFAGAHQDDIISSLGTMILMKDTFELHVIDFTDGAYYKKEMRDVRREEEQAVCDVLGAKIHEVGELDGDAYASREAVAKLVKILQEVKPRAIITHWPLELHNDHMMTTAAILKAARIVGDRYEIYFHEYAYDSKGFPAVQLVDISRVAEEKQRLIRLYVSQNRDDAMCREEMLNSRRRALNLWPPKFANGYAEAFSPLVGRAQGPCIFTEIPQDPDPGAFPKWGK